MISIRPDYVGAARNFKTLLLALSTLICSQLALANENPSGPPGCEEILHSLAKISFDTIYEDTERHPALQQLATIYKERSPAAQFEIDRQLAENHLRKEMSFQVRNPMTGMYDKFVAVPVVGHVAPILERHYNRLVQSTGPVLRALRKLLQNAYSQAEWTVDSLGLQGLPADEAELVIKILKNSIYLEPKLLAPQMRDYPFLAVSGFDGAIVNPKKPENVFFEMNLGTPSGLANNIDLLEDLEKSDPEVHRAIEPYLPEDKTFFLLRDVIERNARAWTHKGGISVVISPGVYNGAHPDVANIARRSGMPLVKSSDLYEDANGDIRLNVGPTRRHPVVTGVYNRMEESFFLQSTSENIPLISPQYEDLSWLRKKTGLPLRDGVIYKWVYGEDGKISDVERGPDGSPLLQEIWDTMGPDPDRSSAPRGSFARAVLNKQLYVSNIGGRLVDDKRLFRIVSTYLAEKRRGGVARPVLGLTPSDLSELYRDPNRFVVKDPANSGGVGVHFPVVMKAEDRDALLARVKANPGAFEVQYISPLVTLPHADNQSYEGVAIDMRIFVLMDEAGEVSAGSNSMLLRTAARGTLKSNTSSGGGYSIAVVLREKANWLRWFRRSPARTLFTPESDIQLAKQVLGHLGKLYEELIDYSDEIITPEHLKELKDRASGLSFELRQLMATFEGPERELPSRLRDFSQNERADVNSIVDLVRHLENSFASLKVNDGPLGHAFSEARFRDVHWYERLRRRLEDPTNISYSPLNSKIRYRTLAEPTVAYYWNQGSERHEKYEMAEIVSVEDPFIQKIIDDVRANNGEVRMMKRRIVDASTSKFRGWRYESPYFWVNLNPEAASFLKPVIGIDLTGDRGLAALAHEYEHFKVWLENYKLRLAEGMDHEAAVRAAVDFVWQKDMIVHGERLAVAAEMQAERDHEGSLFCRAQGLTRPKNFWEKGYVNRVTYPEFEAVRQVMHDHIWKKEPFDEATMNKYMKELVSRALENRKQALEYLGPNGDASLIQYWRYSRLFELLAYPYGIERLNADQTVDIFTDHMRRVCLEISPSPIDCL